LLREQPRNSHHRLRRVKMQQRLQQLQLPQPSPANSLLLEADQLEAARGIWTWDGVGLAWGCKPRQCIKAAECQVALGSSLRKKIANRRTDMMTLRLEGSSESKISFPMNGGLLRLLVAIVRLQ